MDLCRNSTNDTQRQNKLLWNELNHDVKDILKDHELRCEQDFIDILDRHNIKTSVRARMIDWMVEVMNSFRCDD